MQNQADLLIFEIVLIILPTISIALAILFLAIFKIKRLNNKLNRFKNLQFFQIEKERKRIANDLHDFVAGKLTSLKQDLSNNFDEIEDDLIKEKLLFSLRDISNFHDDLRYVVEYIYPKDLMLGDLESGLRKLTEEMSNTQTKVILEYEFDYELSKSQKHQLYRITQEKLANIITYIFPKNIVVSLFDNDNGKCCVLGISYTNSSRGQTKKEWNSLLQKGGRGEFVINERLKVIGAKSDWKLTEDYFQELISFEIDNKI